ncbi:protein NODULATION SIGNALING PATHWAY 2-like [Prosopis cineraria]|uniref:protein NODULATION SIGNALING PATHWAY 2-like n=1 Tax=Prosopis cineraria TaxID=364024 RepID=UPI00240FECFE|nr:protein NODULATION SIGNALING PATHWAY 2-like [Prosopis cineraria]
MLDLFVSTLSFISPINIFRELGHRSPYQLINKSLSFSLLVCRNQDRKKMEPEILEPSWSFYENISSTFDHDESFDFNIDTPLFTTSEDTCSEITSIVPFPSTIFSNDHVYYPIDQDILQFPSLVDDFFMDLDAFDLPLSSQCQGIHIFPSHNLCSEKEDAWSPTPSMQSDMSTAVQAQSSLIIPEEDMEMENQLSLPHLLEAVGEALEQGQNTLAQVILRCISHKVSPLGDPLERLSFNLSQNHDTSEQGTFLKQEARKNFHNAFKAIYQGLPQGRIAHFAANSAILESIPEDSEVIHIIDFDMGEGVQWPPLMETIAHQHKTLKLTSIEWEEEDSLDTHFVSTQWKFEEIRQNLYEHGKSCGLKLKVEEQSIEELVTELKKLNKRGRNGNGKRNFVAFNCMVGLPHMGRVRSRRQVLEFLRVAKDFIKRSSSNRGIITLGDGEACEKLRNSTNFRSFFSGHLVHYHALLESIESNFPIQFSEARSTMESLFVAPCISCEDWLQKWEMRDDRTLQSETELEGRSLREETLMEVGEMLRGIEGSYKVKIEGNNGNEMVLEWEGTQLLRISKWGN